MARLAGIAGGLSGRVGSMVFRQRQGETIATQYQPVVTNPNTDAQQDSRVAFKLMSQLAAIMAPALGSMTVTSRPARKGRPSQRNAFFAQNYGLVETRDTENGKRASIPMEQLQLTSSFISAGTMTISQSGNTITIEGEASPGKKQKVALVGFSSLAGADRPAKIISIEEVNVKNDGSWATNVEIENVRAKGVTDKITVLAYGLIPLSQRMKTKMENINTPANDPFISAVELQKAVEDGEMSVTETIGANFTASPASNNPVPNDPVPDGQS